MLIDRGYSSLPYYCMNIKQHIIHYSVQFIDGKIARQQYRLDDNTNVYVEDNVSHITPPSNNITVRLNFPLFLDQENPIKTFNKIKALLPFA